MKIALKNITPFAKKVYQLVKRIPKGKVTTYKEIGRVLKTKGYQAIGQALRKNPLSPLVPCHRVITTNGNIGGFCGQQKGKQIKRKKMLLKKEGIEFQGKKIKNFNKVLFRFT